jgi:hypothetical protein
VKCFAAVALGFGLIALPACAQHGGGHAGFSGHAASGSHGGFASGSRGGFAASAPARSSGYRSYAAPRAQTYARSYQRGVSGASSALRRPYNGPWRYRRPYLSPYRAGFGYGAPGYGWVSPYVLSYPDEGDDDSSAPPDNGSAYAPDGYADPQEPDQGPYPDQYQQAPLPPWQPPTEAYQPAPLATTPAPASEQAVTLVFKDGRPSEQIHNYILTRTTLFVGDQHRRAIPTDELDLIATAKANQDAGVDFQLPQSTR